MTGTSPAFSTRRPKLLRSFATEQSWLCASVIALLVFASVSRADDYSEMPNAISPRLAESELLSTADANQSLPMSMSFRLQHRDQLDALLTAQQRPGAREYHQWLTPDEFAARFAIPADTYDEIATWLRNQGFTVRTFASRSRLELSGTVDRVQSAFSVRMNAYRHRGRRVLANAGPPWLPARFASAVDSFRLNTFPLAQPVVRVVGVDASLTGLGPLDAYTVYDLNPVIDQGIDGTGQTIAIAARSDFNLNDVTLFQQHFSVPVRAPDKVFPRSNPGIGAANTVCAGIPNQTQRENCIFGEEVEVLLDTEWAGAMAPGASVLVDIADTDIDASLADIVNRHSDAKIISISFGDCERQDPGAVQTMEPMYIQAAAQGQTVLVAAGNSGADGCGDKKSASVNVLGSSAEVTVVGGTALDPGFDGNGDATGHVSEVVWDDSDGASGGGVSTLAAKPVYQNGPGVPDDGRRDQPDVALQASPTQVGYIMVVEDGVLLIGGTSAATPSWAGVVALANQATNADGLGIFNYALYSLGAKQYSQSGPAVFHDITEGNNTFDGVTGFSAGPGYDLASGLGSPDVAALLGALTAPQECPGDCNGDGVVSTSELVTAVQIALGKLRLNQCSSLDTDSNGTITVDELIAAINHALNGC